jgi:ribosomal protein S18 acetylase RimI-like enzyme
MDWTLRRGQLEDAAALVRHNALMALETEGLSLDPATLTAGVKAVLNDPHKGFYLVAERTGAIIGQAMVTFEYSDWRNGWFWWIQSVYVPREARRAGVFRSLYEQIQREAMADPTVIGLRLYVERANSQAQKTYRSLGMHDEHYLVYGVYPLPGRANALAGQ